MTDDDLIRKPQQERSRDTLKRMFDAAERLMAERPFEKISVQQIVKEAGTTTGAFYTRFKDKDSLLETMQNDYIAQTVAELKEGLAQMAGQPSDDHLNLVIGMISAVFRSRPALMRSIALQYWNASEQLVRQQAQSQEHAEFGKQIRKIRGELERIADAFGNPKPMPASHFALKIALSSCRHHYLFSDERTVLTISNAEFERELVKMIGYYLKNGEPGS